MIVECGVSLGALNYENYGIFLIMGNAKYIFINRIMVWASMPPMYNYLGPIWAFGSPTALRVRMLRAHDVR